MDEHKHIRRTDELVSSPDAAKKYRVTNDYIARLCRQGRLKGVMSGRTWYVSETSLDTFFKNSKTPLSDPQAAPMVRMYLKAIPTSLYQHPPQEEGIAQTSQTPVRSNEPPRGGSLKQYASFLMPSLVGIFLLGSLAFASSSMGQRLAQSLRATSQVASVEDSHNSDKVQTHELCIDEVCVTKNQFLKIINVLVETATTSTSTPSN